MIDFPVDEREMRVLVVAPVGRDATLAVRALEDAGIEAVVCDNMEDIEACLVEGAGAAIIAQEALTEPALRQLEGLVRRQPPWSELPLIILTSASRSVRAERSTLRALSSFSNATQLERPLKVATLVSSVQVALQARRRQYEVRQFIFERESAVREREQLVAQMQAIIQNMTEGVTIADLEGNVLVLNDAQIRNVGLHGPHEYRRHFAEMADSFEVTDLRGNPLPIDQWPLARVLAGEHLQNYEVCMRRNGSTHCFTGSYNGATVRDRNGQPILAITTSRDIAEIKRAEAERDELLAKQQRIAETLQRSLLIAPAKSEFPGFTIETEYASAWNDLLVGGDFFDVFRVSDTHIGLVVGDVVGKGLVAAAHTAEVKFALRTILREHPNPAVALERLNSYLLDAHRLDNQFTDTLVAMSLGVIETATGRMRAAVASAEAPLLVHKDGTPEPIKASGLVLGAFPKITYTNADAQMAPGDILIFTTDGITEARKGRDFFGYEGLTQAASSGMALSSVKEMGESIVRAARRFAGGNLQDDACVLLVRRD